MQIKELYNIFEKSPSISTDSRTIQKGDIFFALSGENFNGNKFIDTALRYGASFAVTNDTNYKNKKQCIYVDNTLVALQELAIYHRTKLNIPIVAITGTNGKTTTKELINQVLKQKYIVKSTKGNFNNHIGVPLTILSFNKKTEIGIVEMGANHPKEIEFLCNITLPNYGIITNIGKAHLEGFGSFQKLINTKAELYTSIKNTNGKIFINEDNELLKSLIEEQETISYGTKKNVFCKGKFISSSPMVKFSFNKSEIINSKLIGKYNFENLLAASCVAKYFGINNKKIKEALETYTPTNNRSQIIEKETNKIILDAYNANPTSMNLAIENFINLNTENKVLILGDMFELGKYSDEEHKKIINKLLTFNDANHSTKIFIAGENFYKLNRNNKIISFKTTKDLINHISKLKFHNTWFLIKGSRGMKLEETIKYIKS